MQRFDKMIQVFKIYSKFTPNVMFESDRETEQFYQNMIGFDMIPKLTLQRDRVPLSSLPSLSSFPARSVAPYWSEFLLGFGEKVEWVRETKSIFPMNGCF
jgi:hypothetical protein